MAKWRVEKDLAGIFKWKATSPDGVETIWMMSFNRIIERVSEAVKEERNSIPKPLSDMSVEEREDCVGMWAGIRRIRGIILGYEGKYVKLLCPTPERVCSDKELVVHAHIGLTWVLPGLPRAWTPDGEPVDGAWETDAAELPTKDFKGTYIQHYRRWVTDWEQS